MFKRKLKPPEPSPTSQLTELCNRLTRCVNGAPPVLSLSAVIAIFDKLLEQIKETAPDLHDAVIETLIHKLKSARRCVPGVDMKTGRLKTKKDGPLITGVLRR